jgi:hypothetical protein
LSLILLFFFLAISFYSLYRMHFSFTSVTTSCEHCSEAAGFLGSSFCFTSLCN